MKSHSLFIQEHREQFNASLQRNTPLDHLTSWLQARLQEAHSTEYANIAISHERWDVLEYLLSTNPDLNAVQQATDTRPLHFLLNQYCNQEAHYPFLDHELNPYLEMTRLMIQHGAKIDAVDQEFLETPLHIATRLENVQFLKIMIDLNQPLHALIDAEGFTPLINTFYCQRTEHARLFLATQGIQELLTPMSAQDPYEQRHPLQFLNSVDLATHVLSYGIPVDLPLSKIHQTQPIHFISEPQTLAFWIKSGADPNAKTKTGRTPLHFNVSGHRSANLQNIHMLIQAGADVNAQESDTGNTPLHYASHSPEIQKILIESGANPFIRNHRQQYPHGDWCEAYRTAVEQQEHLETHLALPDPHPNPSLKSPKRL